MSELSLESVDLHQPSLEDLVDVLSAGMKKNFENVEIKVVDCPNLIHAPFHLVSKGLGGKTSIADVGGVKNLLPLPNLDKPQYKMTDILKMVGLQNGMIIGAGGGPFHTLDLNSELIANICQSNGELENESRVCWMVDHRYLLEMLETDEFSLLGNFYCSEGLPGKVLEITASKRTGTDDYVSSIRKTLSEKYQEKPVGLGGVFLIEKGKAKIHIMPRFSSTPLESDDQVNEWLRFFEMEAPLICVGEMVSHDPGLDLRVDHFHCFNKKGSGGHYHYDTTPDTVVYRGYFNIAQQLHRIDRPM